VGTSAAAVEVKRQARRAAQSSSPVLLLGETGTGKELLAHAIHASRRRARSGPFISVNIAAVPDTLLEAEFFGVAPGAYTGADRKGRDGKFKLADGGTLFLDEIGDMPPGPAGQAAARAAGGRDRAAGLQQAGAVRRPRHCRHLARSGEAGARGPASAKTCITA
jgi:transcriptional regulator with AAA-type ATPase domain